MDVLVDEVKVVVSSKCVGSVELGVGSGATERVALVLVAQCVL